MKVFIFKATVEVKAKSLKDALTKLEKDKKARITNPELLAAEKR